MPKPIKAFIGFSILAVLLVLVVKALPEFGLLKNLLSNDSILDYEIHTVWAPVKGHSDAVMMKPKMCIDWTSTRPIDEWRYNIYLDGVLYKGGYPDGTEAVEFSSTTDFPVNITYVMYPKPCSRYRLEN